MNLDRNPICLWRFIFIHRTDTGLEWSSLSEQFNELEIEFVTSSQITWNRVYIMTYLYRRVASIYFKRQLLRGSSLLKTQCSPAQARHLFSRHGPILSIPFHLNKRLIYLLHLPTTNSRNVNYSIPQSPRSAWNLTARRKTKKTMLEKAITTKMRTYIWSHKKLHASECAKPHGPIIYFLNSWPIPRWLSGDLLVSSVYSFIISRH
jgi:hypothetical protein